MAERYHRYGRQQVQSRRGCEVLSREAQIERRALAGDRGATERCVVGFPSDLAGAVGEHLRGAQVVDVDLVDVAGLDVGQRRAVEPHVLSEGLPGGTVDFGQEIPRLVVQHQPDVAVQRLGDPLVQVVVAVLRGDAGNSDADQAILAVVGEDLSARLDLVAVGVVGAHHRTVAGFQQPVVREADLMFYFGRLTIIL